MKKVLLITVCILYCVMITGCGKLSSDITFHENGTVSTKMEVAIDDDARQFPGANVDKNVAELKQTFSKAKITDQRNGFVAEKEYSSIEEYVLSEPELLNPSEDYGGVRYRKGYFFDTYSIDSVFNGNKEIDTEWYRNINFNNSYEVALYSALKNSVNSAQATFSISLPSPADSHNASVSGSNNTTITWDLKPAILEGKDVPIKANFRLYHQNHIDLLMNVIVICISISVIAILLKLFKKDNEYIQKFSHHISVLFLITAVGTYLYLDHELNKIPQLTYKDRIVKEGTLDSEGRDFRKSIERIETGTINSLEIPAKILKEHDVNYEVAAVSTQDSNGFLAHVLGEGTGYVVYDKKYDIVATVHGRKLSDNVVKNFRKDYTLQKDGKISFRPVMFSMFIDEKKGDVDQELGTWSEFGHFIPIYVLFDVDNNDNVIIQNIYSSQGLNPSHYHSDVHNEKYIHLVNTIVTHIDSLRLDMKLREREKKL